MPASEGWKISGQLPLPPGGVYPASKSGISVEEFLQKGSGPQQSQEQSAQATQPQEPQQQQQSQPLAPAAGQEEELDRFVRAICLGMPYTHTVEVLPGVRATFRLLRVSEFDAVSQAAREQGASVRFVDPGDRTVYVSEWLWRYRLVLQLAALQSDDGTLSWTNPGSISEWRSFLKLSGASDVEVLQAGWNHLSQNLVLNESFYSILCGSIVHFLTRVRQMEEAINSRKLEELFR